MGLANSLEKVAKNLTKTLGTTAVLKDVTHGAYNPTTDMFDETVADVTIQIAPWTNTKVQDQEILQIGDVQAIIYINTDTYANVEVNKGEKVVMNSKTYEVVQIAEYIPQAVVIGYYVIMRLTG